MPASTGNSLAVASHRCAGRPCCIIAVTCIQGAFNVSGCPQMNVSSSRRQEGRVPSAREPGTRNRSAALVRSASGPQSACPEASSGVWKEMLSGEHQLSCSWADFQARSARYSDRKCNGFSCRFVFGCIARWVKEFRFF